MLDTLSHYFRILAENSNKGNMDLWLAEHYLCRNRWSLAQKHIERCLIKGDVCDSAKAQHLHREIVFRLKGY